jgi:pimeloyl-ACP methyl ester carboxylesterase
MHTAPRWCSGALAGPHQNGQSVWIDLGLGVPEMAARVHRTISPDGTQIAGEVVGEGPALVLVHGGLGDGNPAMNLLLPSLSERFTCFLVSTRGRGQSGDHTDHSRERHYEDIATFVDGIGEPAALFGHSSGATWSLGAAGRCRALTGLAVYEPALPVIRPVISDHDYERFVAAVDAGRVAEAALIGLDAVVEPNEEERTLIESIAELTGPVLPANVQELPELNRPADLPALARIRVPLTLFQGSRTGDHFKQADRLVQEHVPHGRVIEVEGGHLAP